MKWGFLNLNKTYLWNVCEYVGILMYIFFSDLQFLPVVAFKLQLLKELSGVSVFSQQAVAGRVHSLKKL